MSSKNNNEHFFNQDFEVTYEDGENLERFKNF